MHPGSFVEMLVEILIGHREGLEVSASIKACCWARKPCSRAISL